jgi:TldD protein
MPGGLATVQWDDEGVIPEKATLVKNGILTDYQTTREGAARLASYYEKAGQPVHSHGFAASESAFHLTLQQRPNLTLESGQKEVMMADLIKDVKKGVAIYRGGVATDFQGKNGLGAGAVTREIVNGRLGARIVGGGFLFNSTELWKKLTAIGGPNSASVTDVIGSRGGLWLNAPHDVKGQPTQVMSYSVQAVPSLFTDVALIDRSRKA